MKTFLLQRDADFDPQQPLPAEAGALTQDLELETLFQAMASGDEFVHDIVRKVVLSASNGDVETVRYRQEILKDCLDNPQLVRSLYELAVEALSREKKEYWTFLSRSPALVLSGSLRSLEIFVDVLRKLRDSADAEAARFSSRGFTSLFATLRKELSDEYLANVKEHLAELKFKGGVLMSARVGKGGATSELLLRKAHGESRGWLARLLGRSPPGYTFRLHPRDEAGGRILSGMHERGINLVANAVGQSRDHVQSFFVALRTELAFYLGCLNLSERLAAIREPICFPLPVPAGERRQSFAGLYDVCLALTMKKKVVANAADLHGRSLVIVTGANQGGKSTFLRSIGLAQVMLQAGMYVPAESFEADICNGVFTHYKREEDPTMKSGKLDEELARMSSIAEKIEADALVLFNESFAATNEREGSEIARQVVAALLEKRIKVFFVTHQYEFARGFFDQKTVPVAFLRAERKADGMRTYRVVEGEPLPTSFGEDLYREVFGPQPEAPPAVSKQAAAQRASR